jgi:hypothetical protein
VALVEADRRAAGATGVERRSDLNLPAAAERIGAAVRGHRAIENRVHSV